MRTTGCPTVRDNSYTPLKFYIVQRIKKSFKSCHHESLRIFLVYKTHRCVVLAPHKWWLKIKSIFRYLLWRVSGWAKHKKQKLCGRGVHVQVFCGMKDVMIKKIYQSYSQETKFQRNKFPVNQFQGKNCQETNS